MAKILKELTDASAKVGSVMSISKNIPLSNSVENICFYGTKLEDAAEYMYLGHTIGLGGENQIVELSRRIRLSLAAFGRMRYIFNNSDMPINLKRKNFDSCILLVATYGLETMALTKNSANKPKVMQRSLERAKIGLSLRDKVRNKKIR